MILGKKDRIFLLLLILLLWGYTVLPVAGWSDHFTSDTSPSYVNDSAFQWDIGNSRLKNTWAPWTGAAYYTDTSFGSGTYEYKFTPLEGNLILSLMYGADGTLGTPNNHGTHYQLLLYPSSGGMYLTKVISGSQSVLASDEGTNLTYATHTFTVDWDAEEGTHTVLLDGNPTVFTDISDSTITDSGYIGIGTITDKYVGIDYISVEEAETPTPTPTPTTPVPTTYASRNLSQMKFDDPYSNPSFLDLLQNYSWLFVIILLAYLVIKK